LAAAAPPRTDPAACELDNTSLEDTMRTNVLVEALTFVLLTLAAAISSNPRSAGAEQLSTQPHPTVVTLDPKTKGYARVLGGPPATYSIRSGYVVLAPGESVGKHGTGDYEEVVVVFEGEGKMTITGAPELKLGAGSVAYCPPQTEHDVTNTGRHPLRYLYVVAAVPPTRGE
jgi:mannose-6-phosphate isomerase-like protein (cupin superfamily)